MQIVRARSSTWGGVPVSVCLSLSVYQFFASSLSLVSQLQAVHAVDCEKRIAPSAFTDLFQDIDTLTAANEEENGKSAVLTHTL
jgi:hypothetical protein